MTVTVAIASGPRVKKPSFLPGMSAVLGNCPTFSDSWSIIWSYLQFKTYTIAVDYF